jgi:peptidyl-prolyl cis-trans isomerase D
VGEVSQPIEINNSFIVASITSDAKPGLPDAASVRPYVQTVLMNQKKAQIIQDKFKGNTLESYAESTGSKIVTVDSISFEASFIPNIGNEPKVVGAAFNKALLNKVSAPIAGNSGVFVIEPTSVTAKPSLDGGAEAAKSTMKQSWLQQIQGHFINALQQSAKIEDYRSKFF